MILHRTRQPTTIHMTILSDDDLRQKATRIKAILSDVDGVLTDGGICYDNNGLEIKRFHVHDGLGIKLWRRNGFKFGILTARQSRIVEIRGEELKVDTVSQGFESKWPEAQRIFNQWHVLPSEVCYVGDDLTDLAVLRQVGLAVSVNDASRDVQKECDWVASKSGGQGAIREIIEKILKLTDRWETTKESYVQQTLAPISS